MKNLLGQIYQYRGFILGTVKREFQSRYRNSLFGSFWTILSPLATIAIYIMVFSKLMKARLVGVDDTFGYGVYLCAGVLTWGMFTEVISLAQNMFIANANLLKKQRFPKLCLPVVVMCSSSINLFVVLAIFICFLIVTGRWPGASLFALLPLLTLQMLFAISLGLLFGVINVFFRDVGHFTGVLLMLWFWLTPIIYPISILPEYVRNFVHYNPMTNIIASYQQVFLYGQWPDWSGLLWSAIVAVLTAIFAAFVFNRLADELVDEL